MQRPGARTIRILVADDHGIVRTGLCALIESEPDFELVGVAEDGAEVVEKARALQPDVAVVDICMPLIGGVEATRRILECTERTRVLNLSLDDELSVVRSALAAGSSGYVVKHAAATELAIAIRNVHRGLSYLNVNLADGRAQDLLGMGDGHGHAQHTPLSDRETHVLRLLAEGYSAREIGDRLHVSHKTVATYRQRIATKLGLRSRVDIVRFALETGVLVAR